MVSLALYGDISGTPRSWRLPAPGGAITFDIAARRRLSLYRAYLYLIMWVETAPRGFGQELLDRIHGRVFRPLAAALGNE